MLSRPLTNLLKRDQFKWSVEADQAFQSLKKAMTTAPVLALPDFNQPFVLETDSSGVGVGAVLMQQGRPIAYLSKTLCAKNQALSVYEREFLAVLMAVQKWKHYLMGHKFYIRTDQQSLRYLLDQRITTPVQHKWITKLLGLDYEIQYKKESENRVADALSRVQNDPNWCASVTTVTPEWLQEVIDSYDGDEFITKIFSSKQSSPDSCPYFSISGKLLRYKGRLVVGNKSDLRTRILSIMHSSSYGGHSGINGTYMRLKSSFFWPGMKSEVATLVKACDVCIRNKPNLTPSPGLLQPLPIPDQPWSHITMDFIEGLPKSGGKDVIMVVIDRLTKYGHFVGL